MPRHTLAPSPATSLLPSLALSFVFFGYAIFVAHRQDWQAHDIVWSMWVSSLIGGYLLIVVSIFLGLVRPAAGADNTPDITINDKPVNLKKKGLGHSLFLLLFFTIHFGGFHFVHGQIMQGFFPLADQELNFWAMLQKTVSDYWYFVIVAVLNLFPQLSGLWRNENRGSPSFELPYKAVIRNHLMIFVVAFAQDFVSTPVLLYLLLVLYFFPFEEFLDWRRRGKSPPID